MTAANITTRGTAGRRPGPLGLAAGLVALLLAVPVLGVLASLFEPDRGTIAHLAGTVLGDYVANTLWLVLAVALGTFLVGTATAWTVTMCRFPGRRVLEWALVLPLAMPAYVIAYLYTDLLQFSGPVQTALRAVTGWGAGEYWFPEIHSLGGAILVFIAVLYPYVYLLARAAFLEQSICVIDVSRTLGCTPWGSFFRVALPLARPAIAGGVALALMETLADFGTVSYFGLQTFTTGIYRAWFSMGDRIAAGKLSCMLLLFAMAVLAFERWSRGQARYHHTTQRYRPIQPFHLDRAQSLAALAVCILPLVIGFILPALTLLRLAFEGGDAQFGARYLGLVANSVTLAGIAAAIAVALATLIGYGMRLEAGPLVAIAGRLAGMGYAIPGSIIAVGVLIPLASLDNLIDGWARASFGISTGLLLTGGIFGLVYAYNVRFLAVSLQSVEASLAKISPSIDHAARALGASAGGTLWRVHRPLLSGGMLSAFLIVFVDVMKELPATLLMRPFNFDTLAVQAYNLASDERLAEASTAALAIVAVGLIPVLIVSRSMGRPGPASGAG